MGRTSDLAAADAGLYSATNVPKAEEIGVNLGPESLPKKKRKTLGAAPVPEAALVQERAEVEDRMRGKNLPVEMEAQGETIAL